MNTLWKSFKKLSLEESLVVDSSAKEIVIPKKEEEKVEEIEIVEPVKKQTATTIHLQIKSILDDNATLSGYEEARNVLDQALQDGFSGKRLTRWKDHIDDYFLQLEKTRIIDSMRLGHMGSTTKSMYQAIDKKKL